MSSANSPSALSSANSARPIFVRILKLGGILALAIAVLGGAAGLLADGQRGLLSALVGTVMSLVFLGMTAASILVANRFSGTEFFTAVFFGVVLGTWILKFVIFLILVVVLRDQPWINPLVLFLSIVASVLGSLVVDMIVVLRSRLPYVSDPARAGR